MTLLADFKFPRYVGAVGTELPGAAGPGLSDFEGIEHPNWPNSNQGRMTWVFDPAGTGERVLRWEIRDNDLCSNQYGPDGQRLEMWTPSGYRSENNNGAEGWFAWSVFLGDGVRGNLYRYPTSPWALHFQHHDGGGSPEMALEALNGRWKWVMRETASTVAVFTDIAPQTRGRWHFFLNYVKFSTGSDGACKLWHSLDSPPNELDPPQVSKVQRTCYGNGNGLTTLHMYRADGAPVDYPWVAYQGGSGRYGFGRSGTAAGAKALAGWTTVAPPDPDVAKAISEIKETLEWMRRSKTTSGLGYSVQKVKLTHAYAALVALGGSWP